MRPGNSRIAGVVKRIVTMSWRIFSRTSMPPRSQAHKTIYDDSAGNWTTIASESSGYSSPEILSTVAASTRAVVRGEAAYERDGCVFPTTEYVWPVAAMLSWTAATEDGELRVLDFGGSLGSTYLQNRPLTRHFRGLDWRIIEQEHYVEVGKKDFSLPGLSFYVSTEDALSDFTPSLSFFGSSLQYLEHPMEELSSVASHTQKALVLDRLPLTDEEGLVVKQIVPDSIVRSSYPMHVLGRAEITRELGPDWSLVGEFESLGGKCRTSSGLEFAWSGMIFIRKDFFE